MRIAVIGGGASGLVAAIEAARGGAAVHVLEKMKKPAKKLLVTGNGRCNLTNQVQKEDCYRSHNAEQAFSLIQRLGYDFTKQYFRELGVFTVNKNGYEYPVSGQAETVSGALISKARSLGVCIDTECTVTGIARDRTGFQVTYRKGEADRCRQLECHKVILAAGGQAAPKQGSDGSGFRLAAELGHRILSPMPALTALYSPAPYLKQLAGVRTGVRMKLNIDGIVTAAEEGELQITANGLSGVAVFQMSRYAVEAITKGKKVSMQVDLLPRYSSAELSELFREITRACSYKTLEEVLDGLLNWKLSHILLKQLGFLPEQPCRGCSRKQWKTIADGYKNWIVPITGYASFDHAQVTQGGVDLAEIHMETMESRLVPGLYLTGEILDVDGTCGGYNLQWAWSTGYLAGRESAGMDI